MGDKSVSVLLKKRWASDGQGVGLKEYARKLAAGGDQMAIDWFAHKKGSLNQLVSDKNKARIALEKSASKLARSKKKGGGKKAEVKDVAVPAK